jgi:hypothetical protein
VFSNFSEGGSVSSDIGSWENRAGGIPNAFKANDEYVKNINVPMGTRFRPVNIN